jgi:hypothetical protein
VRQLPRRRFNMTTASHTHRASSFDLNKHSSYRPPATNASTRSIAFAEHEETASTQHPHSEVLRRVPRFFILGAAGQAKHSPTRHCCRAPTRCLATWPRIATTPTATLTRDAFTTSPPTIAQHRLVRCLAGDRSRESPSPSASSPSSPRRRPTYRSRLATNYT